MTNYKSYKYDLLDRMDLKYSIYVGGLDVQYSHDVPYLWTFCFDLTGEVISGRTWDDLISWFEKLESFGYNGDHKLIIYLNDLSQFFHFVKKELLFDTEMLAKSPSEILICSYRGLEFRDFQAYTEKDIDKLIILNDVNAKEYHKEPKADKLSYMCVLSEAEFDYSSRRVLEMTKAIRTDIDLLYQGDAKHVPPTKTSRIENIISANLRKSDPDKFIYWRIHAMNPISTEFGREILLPQLRKAFFGGTSFIEKKYIDLILSDIDTADLISAYCSEFLCSKFPISKFKVLDVPEDYQDIFKKSYYSKKALLITFTAENVKVKKTGIPILPAASKHYYFDKNNPAERQAAIARAQSLKLKEDKGIIRMCLTDIDFELFVRYYDIEKLTISGILGATYGYLPDYIVKTVAQLYADKAKAKAKKNALDAAGLLTELQQEVYNDFKSILARLYGIFTRSPIVTQYIYDHEKRDIKVKNANYLVSTYEWRPVVYQWGVWTTALTRKKICDLRDTFKDRKIRVISGDTDCLNFKKNPRSTAIIAEFNKKIKSAVKRRCELIGIDPEALHDLGTLEVKSYKFYKFTGNKQYAFIQTTEKGDQFKFKVGGMNTECTYFDDYSDNPIDKLTLFGLGTYIPARYSPRLEKRVSDDPENVSYTDRDGNAIRAEVKSRQLQESRSFYIFDPYSPLTMQEKIKAAKATSSTENVMGQLAEYTRRLSTKTPKIEKESKK